MREDKAEYVITYRGQPVAVLRPIEPAVEDADKILALAAEVFAGLSEVELAAVDHAIQRRPHFFGESMDDS